MRWGDGNMVPEEIAWMPALNYPHKRNLPRLLFTLNFYSVSFFLTLTPTMRFSIFFSYPCLNSMSRPWKSDFFFLLFMYSYNVTNYSFINSVFPTGGLVRPDMRGKLDPLRHATGTHSFQLLIHWNPSLTDSVCGVGFSALQFYYIDNVIGRQALIRLEQTQEL